MKKMINNLNIAVVGASGSIGGHFLDVILSKNINVISLGRSAPSSKIKHIKIDLSNLNSVQKAGSEALSELGKIDVVINFSGVHHKPMDFKFRNQSNNLKEFDNVLNINLRGAFIITQVFGELFVNQRNGHIIHLCSNASRLSLYGSYAYNSSKHGLEGLIKTAAAQLAPYKVRVNGVAPGTVETDLNKSQLRDDEGNYKPRAASILAHTPTKKFATLEGITETLIATCVPQRHLTGNIIFCDDGYNVEGHSWPEGNIALYKGMEKLDNFLKNIEKNESKN